MNKSAIGKKFEKELMVQADKINHSKLIRLKDSSDYAAIANSNECDFIWLTNSGTICLELKVRQTNRINFKSDISSSQWEGLKEISDRQIDNVHCGFIFWFHSYDKTYYVDFKVVQQLKESGMKSISLDDCDKLGIEVIGTKRRKYWDYDLDRLIEDIGKL